MKSYLRLCFGAFLSGVGIAIASNTGLGADPITVFLSGLSQTFGISVGVASSLTLLVMALIAWLLERDLVGLGTLLTPFCMQAGIDLVIPLFPKVTQFPANYLVMFFGLIVIALGIALAISAHVGQQGTDALILALSHRLKLPYYVIRWGTDLSLLIAGVLLGGSFNPATVIAIVCLGKLISFFYSHLNGSKAQI